MANANTAPQIVLLFILLLGIYLFEMWFICSISLLWNSCLLDKHVLNEML